MRFATEAELGIAPTMPVGTWVEIEHSGQRFVSVGSTRPEIASRLGWTQGNVWLPEVAREYILASHPVFSDLMAVISLMLLEPDSVHQDPLMEGGTLFVVSARKLREAGLLMSRSAKFVDAVVELRVTGGGAYLRLFHLSPASRNRGGEQLWP